MPSNYADNTLSTATNLNITPTSQTLKDCVGSLDSNDYYSFTIKSSSSFNLSLSGLSADANVQLLNSNNSVIASSNRSGNKAESINTTLNTGTYYIRVFSKGNADTYYNLSVSAKPVDFAGNTTSTARKINVGTAVSSFSDWVGSVDTADYYRFTLNSNSNFSSRLNNLSQNADLELLDINGIKIQNSNNTGTTAETINRQLNAGTYYLRVYSSNGENTNYNLSVSATLLASELDWFSQNLRDSGVINLTRNLAADGQLNRKEAIAILRDTKDGGVVDGNELQDLRTILSNATLLKMEDYVRVLTNKVINGDVANQKYQGSTLGNLYDGSSDIQIENLISKWFFGSDRPTTKSSSHIYQYANGALFQEGINVDDVKQGSIGDCYYLSTLASIALEKPSYIQNMFIDNNDGTYTLRFFKNQVADYLTVDRYLPTNSLGKFVYASAGSYYNNSSNELWVALLEKAYAQLNESGWIGQDGKNSYAGIEGGWMSYPMQQITGLSTSWKPSTHITEQQLIDLTNSNKLLTAGFYSSAYGVVANHAYTITSYDSSNRTFHMRNPWSYQHVDLTWEQLLSLNPDFIWSNA